MCAQNSATVRTPCEARPGRPTTCRPHRSLRLHATPCYQVIKVNALPCVAEARELPAAVALTHSGVALKLIACAIVAEIRLGYPMRTGSAPAAANLLGARRRALIRTTSAGTGGRRSARPRRCRFRAFPRSLPTRRFRSPGRSSPSGPPRPCSSNRGAEGRTSPTCRRASR